MNRRQFAVVMLGVALGAWVVFHPPTVLYGLLDQRKYSGELWIIAIAASALALYLRTPKPAA